ncbi:MAG: hypothetical protein KME27_00650 [Lyngbya sp. HA4199-MV5]|jgi:uncharacterized membrane protein YeaQ/YmgE (transglycosylase-associated protein family)|nr:hypothetical protein [Lyngbya sp. HA4199-MV5]
MDLSHIAVQLMAAIVCGWIANMLIPGQIPGKFLGFVLTGLVGVWLGETVYRLLKAQHGLNVPFLSWGYGGVAVVPSIIGCAIIIYIVTTFVRWGHYHR